MQHVITRIKEYSPAYKVVKSVSVLLACRWVADAWHKVSSETITKCFRKAGEVLDSNFQVVTGDISLDEYPFAELEVNDATEGTLRHGYHRSNINYTY